MYDLLWNSLHKSFYLQVNNINYSWRSTFERSRVLVDLAVQGLEGGVWVSPRRRSIFPFVIARWAIGDDLRRPSLEVSALGTFYMGRYWDSGAIRGSFGWCHVSGQCHQGYVAEKSSGPYDDIFPWHFSDSRYGMYISPDDLINWTTNIYYYQFKQTN